MTNILKTETHNRTTYIHEIIDNNALDSIDEYTAADIVEFMKRDGYNRTYFNVDHHWECTDLRLVGVREETKSEKAERIKKQLKKLEVKRKRDAKAKEKRKKEWEKLNKEFGK